MLNLEHPEPYLIEQFADEAGYVAIGGKWNLEDAKKEAREKATKQHPTRVQDNGKGAILFDSMKHL
jgi:hypothetical protein